MEYGLEVTISEGADGSNDQRSFRKSSIKIGRNALNDLHVDKPFVSQFHAVLELDGANLILRDLGSTNGTLVGAQRLRGESFVFGDVPEVRFAVLGLLFHVRRLHLQDIPAPKSDHRPMAVTGFLQAPSREVLAALESAQNNDPAEAQQIERLYAAYRGAWAQLQNQLQTSTLKRSAAARPSFVSALSGRFPALSGEADFHRLAEMANCDSIAVRDTKAENRIASEGVRELALEYVPQMPPPESGAELVQFLTRVRETLSLFFKSFVPLRDGYHQLLKDLGIPEGQMAKRSPVEAATSPAELSALVLDPRSPEARLSEMESMFADLMIHQVAMVNGVMTGVRELVEQLSPEQVRQTVEGRGRSGFQLGGPGAKQYWEEYERRHGDLAEEKQIFALLFGRRFSAAYGAVKAESAGAVSKSTHPPGSPGRPRP